MSIIAIYEGRRCQYRWKDGMVSKATVTQHYQDADGHHVRIETDNDAIVWCKDHELLAIPEDEVPETP